MTLSTTCCHGIALNARWDHRTLTKFEVHVICYLRRADDFMESRYKQFIKDDAIGLTDDFNTFFKQRHHECDFSWLNKIESFFGKNSLTVLNYDEYKGKLAYSLFDFIGLNKAIIDRLEIKEKNVNSSFCMIQAELTRLRRKYSITNNLFQEFNKSPAFISLSYITDEQKRFLTEEYNYKKLFDTYKLRGE
jgi:hypothetical protein